MKNLFFLALALATALYTSSCETDDLPNDSSTTCDNLPHTQAPAGLTGSWANGFTSFTQIVDAYDGRFLGTTWSSGKYFKFTAAGTRAEFYFMAKSQFSTTATRAEGSVAFDEGSTAESGSFVFYACSAHYKGWGSVTVDRPATQDELANNLSRRYYYRREGEWLRIDPSGTPNDYSSSFRKLD